MSTTASSGPATPSTSLDKTDRASSTSKTPDTTSEGPKEVKKERDRVKMPPPPLPLTNGHAAPPRMARMPSLSEITSHLYIPSPHTSTTPKTPPRPTRTDSSGAIPPSATYAASPSGRLKLPVSAMTRKRSNSISKTPTLGSLAAAPRAALERRGSNESHPSEDGAKVGSDDTKKGGEPKNGANSSHAATLGKDPSKEYISGYRDVPSLSAIRHRINLSQSSSGKNRESKADDEVVDMESVETLLEDTKIADSPVASASTAPTTAGNGSGKGKQHPLAHSWTLYYDAKNYMPSIEQSAGSDGGTGRGEYEKSLLRVGKIDTVEGFARHMNNLRIPSQIKPAANYHLFKGEIRPMWEDPANHDGGKWVLLFRHAAHLLDIAWENLTMALIGNILDPDDKICGIVASNRPKANRLQIWTRGKDDVEALNEMGKRCLEMMGIEPGEMDQVSLEYQYNAANTHPPPNTFLYIPFASRSFTPSTPSRLGAMSSPIANGSASHLSLALSSTNPSPNPNYSGPLNTRSNNLSINVIHHNGSSPLSPNTRAENRPVSPMQITPTPSPKMQYSLPRAPDSTTIKASMTSSTSLGPNGGTSMRRLGSGQGTNAFAGPMPGGARSPRAGEAKLAPPTAVSVQGA